MSTSLETREIPRGRAIAVVFVIVLAVLSPLALAIATSNHEQRTPSGMTPAATYSKSATSNGQEIQIVAISRTDCTWNDVAVQVGDGINFAEWEPDAGDLDSGSTTMHDYGPSSLGALTVFLNVTDLTGNGYVSSGDICRVTTGGSAFSTSTVYTFYLVFEPSEERIGTGVTFTG